MNFNKFKGALSNRKIKYGGYSAIITAVVIAVLIAVNLIVDQIPLRYDLTSNQMYTLSEQTMDIIEGLDEDIVIYGVYDPATAEKWKEEYLTRYNNASDRISITYIDPVRDPMSAQRFVSGDEQILNGSIVVESGEKFKVIKPSQMFNYSYNQNDPMNAQVESLSIEQHLTSAIHFVSGAEIPAVYMLQGHGEAELNRDIQDKMELENMEIKELDLISAGSVPDDASMIIINSPDRDITSDEEEYLREYLENEGDIMFMMDINQQDMENFQSLLRSYGVEMGNSLIFEGATESFAYGNPLYLIPAYEDHEITKPISSQKQQFILPFAQNINTVDVTRRTLKIEPMLVTSDQAFGRSDFENNSMEKSSEDTEGPFNLAVAITDTIPTTDNKYKESRLVVIGSSSFIETGLEGSRNLLLNSFNWLLDREEGVTIRPKDLLVQPLEMNDMQYRIYGILTAIIIPAALLIMGLVVWLRRRHL